MSKLQRLIHIFKLEMVREFVQYLIGKLDLPILMMRSAHVIVGILAMEAERNGSACCNSQVHECRVPAAGPKHKICHKQENSHNVNIGVF